MAAFSICWYAFACLGDMWYGTVGVVLGDVQTFLELVPHDHVGEQVAHGQFWHRACLPTVACSVGADLLGLTHRVAELVKRLAQTLAVIEDEYLMPDVRDRVGVRRAGEAVPVCEVLLNLVERFRALTVWCLKLDSSSMISVSKRLKKLAGCCDSHLVASVLVM